LSPRERQLLIEPKSSDISISSQCSLLQISRSSYYYKPKPISSEDIFFMNEIDKIYTKFPYFGERKITVVLKRNNFKINHKKVGRLMGEMGIQGICPRKNLSLNKGDYERYPYLLKGLDINHSNQVWGTDITYIKMKTGFLYLTAVLDWYSRFVLAWELSNTLSTSFCLEAMKNAMKINIPEIANSDQGVQYTSHDWQNLLLASNVQISMDDRGRAFDNIFTERLWRSVKYEEVYLKDYETPKEAKSGLSQYFHDYNFERPHQSLEYLTPAEVYFY
jgi:putative transposase